MISLLLIYVHFYRGEWRISFVQFSFYRSFPVYLVADTGHFVLLKLRSIIFKKKEYIGIGLIKLVELLQLFEMNKTNLNEHVIHKIYWTLNSFTQFIISYALILFNLNMISFENHLM